MLLGHYAVAMAAKKVAPKTSLGLLVAAAQFADFLWPLLLFAGVERVAIEPGITRVTPLNFLHYPWSHSLSMLALWGAVAAVVYLAWKRHRRGAIVLALLVVSHWYVDVVVHRPDMPVNSAPDAVRFGLGLWNSIGATAAVEFGLLALGLWIYTRATRATNRTGALGIYIFAAVMGIIWVANLFGPPPPDVNVLAFSALFLWITAPIAWWIDRNREPVK